MKHLAWILPWVLGLAAASPAGAQERPEVTVSFELAVPRWVSFFDRDQPELEKRAAEALAQWLNKEFRFASYKPGSAGTRHLKLRLGVAPEAEGRQRKETQLRLELVGQNPPQAVTWQFRPENTYSAPTSGIEPFVKEIEFRLGAMDKQLLVKQLLSKIPIADRADLWKDPVGWVIPYRKAELCMDFKSLLRVESQLQTGAGVAPREFLAQASTDFQPPNVSAATEPMRGRLFTEVASTHLHFAELGAAKPGAVAIRAIYVVEYLPLEPCVAPVPPAAVSFREGPP